ncbi:MAG: DegT/DnrJ/EryC1/StrS family aminotransferase [Rhodospirillaceae bacterium]|nr:DegT/DnrJ/EryC1/StrS family aminotransferase [Rhodospirillaceae bacterium]
MKKLKAALKKEFSRNVYFYDSGRSALLKILEGLKRDGRDEVIVQSYTCVVVVNAIIAAGYKPVYVDLDKNGINMCVKDLKKKISKNTRAMIVQHTFGFPDKIDEIKNLTKDHKFFLIEDLAHSINGKYKDKLLGTYSDAAFISFGSGKVLSSSRGGVALTKRLKLENDELLPLEKTWKHLLKIVCFEFLKPIYFFFRIGKTKIYLLSKLGFLPKVITQQEKQGLAPEVFSYSPKLASIAYMQWKGRKKNLRHRRKLAATYSKELKDIVEFPKYNEEAAYMRFPIFVDDPEKLFKFMKKHHILLGVEWSGAVIVPKSIDLRKTKYKGGCPQAEKTALRIINLPTDRHVSVKKAKAITKLIKKFYAN